MSQSRGPAGSLLLFSDPVMANGIVVGEFQFFFDWVSGPDKPRGGEWKIVKKAKRNAVVGGFAPPSTPGGPLMPQMGPGIGGLPSMGIGGLPIAQHQQHQHQHQAPGQPLPPFGMTGRNPPSAGPNNSF
jgi:hypothetical protein